MQPLHILCFLLPLLIAYEIGSVMYLTDPESGVVDTVAARSAVATFFENFGVVGLHLPAVTLVVVLLIWHILKKDPWRIHPPVLGAMLVESALWTLPLIALAVLIQIIFGPPAGAQVSAAMGELPVAAIPAVAPAGTPGTAEESMRMLQELPLGAKLTVAIGAGLYEELLFRMVGIAAVHLVLVDLLKLRDDTGRLMAVIITATAFAFYHELRSEAGGLDAALFLFYALAGGLFGAVYLWRGFGIVVVVHALYDVFALTASGGV